MKQTLAVVLLAVAVWGGYSYVHRRAKQTAAKVAPPVNTGAARALSNANPSPTTPKAQEPALSGGLPIHTDVSQGATKRFAVAPRLPEFTFKFYPGTDLRPDYAVIETVEVYRGQETAPLQTLKECAMDEPPYRGAEWAFSEDFNFDGYKDLAMLKWWGVTGNEGFCVWLFNPATGKFEYNEAFELEGKLGLDPVRKVITVRDHERLAGREYSLSTYAIINNKPVLIEYEDQTCDPDGKAGFKRAWYKPQGEGGLIETRSEMIPDKEGMCGPDRSINPK